MIGFRSLATLLAFFALFAGIIGSISYDVLLLIGKPSMDSVKIVVNDLASIVVNSQGEISESIQELKTADSNSYKTFLVGRIIGGSLVTLFLIWLFYKIIKFWFESPKPTDKLVIILIAILIVWIIGIASSIIVGKVNLVPFYGWVDLVKNRNLVINYLLTNVFNKP